MRVSTVVHIERSDRIAADSGNGSHWIEIAGRDGEAVPVYARTPEQFDALAIAAHECARRMRDAEQPGPLTLEQELDRAG